MSPRLRAGLLRCYPSAWRSRYGEELEAMIEAESAGHRNATRITLDLIAGAARERLRALGLADGGVPGPARARGGVLLVLCSWALLVLGGGAVQKFSEHWEALTPASSRPPAQAAFAVLVIAGSLGCLLVAAGILAATPRLIVFLRGGGWPAVRGGTRRAVGLTVIAAFATGGLALWAHGLSNAARNGGDAAYSAAFLCWAALLACTLMAWTSLAASCARHIAPAGRLLRLESAIALGVALAAVAATLAAALWWGALAANAPAALHGRAAGGGSAIPVALLLDVSVMALGSAIAAVGGLRCARELAGGAAR